MATDATIGTAADHASITLWEADTDNDLAGLGIFRGLVKKEELAAETPNITGATNTDATNYRELTTDVGAAFNDNSDDVGWKYDYNSSYASMANTGGYTTSLNLTEAFSRCTNMQLKSTSAAQGRALILGGAAESRVAKNCILTSGSRAYFGGLSTTLLINTLMIRSAADTEDVCVISYGMLVVNCTAVNLGGASNSGDGIVSSTGNSAKVVNSYSVGFADGSGADYSGTFGASNNNASVDNTHPGTSGVDMVAFTTADVISVTDDFTPVASGDFDAAGAEDVTNAPLDVLGVARPTACEIGPMQIPVAVAGGRLLLINPPGLDGGFGTGGLSL